MSGDGSLDDNQTEVMFKTDAYESSDESSRENLELTIENKKKILYSQGLYSPGSGEICPKYVAMSASSVLKHAYYKYPALTDPGILKALVQPENKILYPADGQECYLAICEEMNQCPVRSFYRGLSEETINLRYYCVNPLGIRAMALALQFNVTVKILELTDNFLNEDACYHLGEMLTVNGSLKELNLSGCRIGSEGARRLFHGLHINRALKILKLNHNDLGDIGTEYLAKSIIKGIDIQELYLTHNKINGEGCLSLAEAFETHNKFTILDLSWNNLYSPNGTYVLLTQLSENINLRELYLSWNSLAGIRIGNGIKNVLNAPGLQHLDLSNNRIENDIVKKIAEGLCFAGQLNTLDLSHNPLTPLDALVLVEKMKRKPEIKLKRLLMDNVFVNAKFLVVLSQVLGMKSRKGNTTVTYGGVVSSFKARGVNLKDIVLNRIEYLSKKPKKKPVDFALFALQLLRDGLTCIELKEFTTMVHTAGAALDDDLLDELCNLFPGPRSGKTKTINVLDLVDYCERKWPDRKLPPPPPPLPPSPQLLTEQKTTTEKS